jgi:hypothetical protein
MLEFKEKNPRKNKHANYIFNENRALGQHGFVRNDCSAH